MDLDKLGKWLGDHGYPLEMKVALACVSAGLGVVRSEYYEDKQSGQFREVDVVASTQGKSRRLGNDKIFVRCRLVIECKSSLEFPWVVFTVGRRLSNTAMIAQTPTSTLGKKFVRALAQQEDASEWPLFKMPPRMGYGATAGFRKPGAKDPVYDSLMSLGNATAGIVKRYNASKNPLVAEICFPVIVTSAPIVEARMEKDESISLTEADQSLISWRNPLVGNPHTIIRLVHEPAFQDFAQAAKDSFDKIIDNFSRRRLTNLFESASG